MVVWSKLAQIDYWNNIDYLLENWSEKEAKHFIDRVTKVIDIIEKSPQLFLQSEIPSVYRVPVVS
jgi:plasmid stabilization system protein ParE